MLVIALSVFNPWYHLLLIGLVLLLWPTESAQPNDEASGFLRMAMLRRIAFMALMVGGGFNVLAVRVGETVLIHLPDSLPIFGGPLYAEALLYGVLNALRVISILFAFGLFSRMVRYADLLRLAPSAFFELGLVLSIGFTLAPFTLRAFRDIREAQTLRGHRPRGLRGLLPLVSPLVVSGMERALNLAESMEARGYGGGLPNADLLRRVRLNQLLLLAGLGGLLLILGLDAFLQLATPLLWLLLTLLGALMVRALSQLSALSGRTRLHRGHWGVAETLVSLGAFGAIGVVLFLNRATLVWDIYRLSAAGLPPFDPWVAIALLGLAMPLLFNVPVAPKAEAAEAVSAGWKQPA